MDKPEIGNWLIQTLVALSLIAEGFTFTTPDGKEHALIPDLSYVKVCASCTLVTQGKMGKPHQNNKLLLMFLVFQQSLYVEFKSNTDNMEL